MVYMYFFYAYANVQNKHKCFNLTHLFLMDIVLVVVHFMLNRLTNIYIYIHISIIYILVQGRANGFNNETLFHLVLLTLINTIYIFKK